MAIFPPSTNADYHGAKISAWFLMFAGVMQFIPGCIHYFLPDGDGDELCRRLREAPTSANTMIAIITGTYREDIIKRCLEAGAVECMFKNEAKELFLARVGSLARQIQMQKKVAAEKQRLDGILGSVGEGVYGVDSEGLVTFLNPTGMRMLGMIDETDVIGKSAHALFHHAAEDGNAIDPAQSPLARAYAEGQVVNALETVFWTRDRTPIPVECSVLPLDIGGRREGSVVVFRNIGERKSADRLRWELALSTTEVDISKIQVGQAITVMWRGSPVFIRRRTPEEIKSAQDVDLAVLKDPQPDSERVQPGKEEWLILVGVCTHLGCIPQGQKPTDVRGEFGGWLCSCHGSQYDTSGRIRKGPAPRNLEVPKYAFKTDTTVVIG